MITDNPYLTQIIKLPLFGCRFKDQSQLHIEPMPKLILKNCDNYIETDEKYMLRTLFSIERYEVKFHIVEKLNGKKYVY